MGALILILLSSFGFGLCFRLYKESYFHVSYHIVYTIVAGMACWCLILFLLGITGKLSAYTIWPLVLGGIGAAVRFIVNRKRNVWPPKWRMKKSTRLEKIISSAILLFLLVTFIRVYAPVTGGITNDEIHTHLSIPAGWLRNGSIAPLGYSISYMGENGELLFSLAQLIAGAFGARLLSWAAYCMVLLMTFQIMHRAFDRVSAFAGVAIIASNPLFFRGASVAFLDTLGILFIIAAFGLYMQWRNKPSMQVIISAALCAGVGCGIKPFNVIYTGILFFVMSADIILKTGYQKKVRTVIIAAGIVFVAAAPWPLRMLQQTGSPTFPPPPFWVEAGIPEKIIGNKIPYTDGEVEQFYKYVNSRYGDYQRSVKNGLLLLWDMTMQPETFQAGDSIGTVLLTFFPLMLFVALKQRNRFVVVLYLVAVISSAAVYVLVLPEARYYMSVMVLLVIAYGGLFTTKMVKSTMKIVCLTVLTVNIVFSIGVMIRIGWSDLHAVFSKTHRERRILDERPFCEAMRFIHEHHGHDTVIVLYDSPVWYYLKNDYVIDPDGTQDICRYNNAVLLDIDYSQVVGRNLFQRKGNYCIHPQTDDLSLIFKGPDARVYTFSDRKKRVAK